MWVLISQEDNNVKYTLLGGQDYKVGRANADILLPTDKSISRSHAFIKITHLESNVTQPHKLPILTITDSSSFGSVVAGEKFKGGTKDINPGNNVKFGTQNSIFKAVFEPMVVTTSCLDVSGKKDMKQLMMVLGGHVVNEWRKDCTMLIMSQLSVTVKVICALINQRAIVTPKYLTSLVESIKLNKPAPNPDDFLPPIAESQLNPNEVSFKKNPRRLTLFQGLVFIFLSPKQFKKLNMAVELAGGTPMLMEEGSDNNEDDFLVSANTRVMSCDATANLSKNAKEWVQHVSDLVTRNKKRMINDAELGYAVLYCSTQKHCNPDVADGGEHVPPLPSQSLSMPPMTSQISQQDMRVSETQLTAERARRRTAGSSTSDVSVVDNSFVPDTEKRRSSSGASAAGTPARTTRSNLSAVVAETPTQKRKRESVDEDEFTAPAPKTSKTEQPQVKQEPVTPSKLPTTRGKKPTSPRATRATASVKPETLSDNDEQDGSTLSAQTRGRYRRSPSPAPELSAPKTRKSPARQAPKVEIDMSQDVDAMLDSIPSRGRRRRNRSPTPEPQTVPKVESPGPTRSRVAPVVDADASIDDAFERLPSRRRGRRGRTPSPDPESAVKVESPQKAAKTRNIPVVKDDINIDDAFDNLPSKRGRRAREKSPAPQPTTSNIKSTESPVPNRPSPRKGQRGGAAAEPVESAKVKTEPITPAKPTAAELKRAEQRKEETNRASEVPTGFLTATKSIEGQRCKVDKDYAFEAPAEPGVTHVEEASLVVASAGRPRAKNRQTNLPDGTCKWKGRIVKNFKKFRKTSNAGANGLPRIIGGADLMVHRNAPNKEKDQWLLDLAQNESQHNEEDEIAKQLFEWEPTSRRSKAGRK